MPRKKVAFPEDAQEEKYEEVWDIRKIIAGVVILLLLIAGGIAAKELILGEKLHVPTVSLPSVKGIQTFNAPDQVSHVKITLPSQQDVQNQIKNIQEQVGNINVAEIASSSPQVQQVLKQIENLPSGPESQVKDACMRLCNNL